MDKSKIDDQAFARFLRDMRRLRAYSQLPLGEGVLTARRDETPLGRVMWLILEYRAPQKVLRSTTLLLAEDSRVITSSVLIERIGWLNRTLQPYYNR